MYNSLLFIYKQFLYYILKYVFNGFIVKEYEYILPKNYSIYKRHPILNTIVFPYTNFSSMAPKTLTLEPNSRIDDQIIKRHCQYYLGSSNPIIRKEFNNYDEDIIFKFNFNLIDRRSNSKKNLTTLVRFKNLNIINILTFFYYYSGQVILEIKRQKFIDKFYIYPKNLNKCDVLSFCNYSIYKDKYVLYNNTNASKHDYRDLKKEPDIKILDFLNINNSVKNNFRNNEFRNIDIFKYDSLKNTKRFNYNIPPELMDLVFINMSINSYYNLNSLIGNKFFIVFLDGNMEIFSSTKFIYKSKKINEDNNKLINIDCKKCFLQSLVNYSFPDFESINTNEDGKVLLSELTLSSNFCNSSLGITKNYIEDSEILYSYKPIILRELWEKLSNNKGLYCFVLANPIYCKMFPLLYTINTYPIQELLKKIIDIRAPIVEILVDSITIKTSDIEYIKELFGEEYNIEEYSYLIRNNYLFGIHS